MAKPRVWELDALRGIFILCVIAVHGVFDLRYFAGADLPNLRVFEFIAQYGGAVFIVLSGICATLGSRSFQRGTIVFGCGLAISVATLVMAQVGMAGQDVVIRFGVLHLLGFCMMIYPILKKLPTAALVIFGAFIVACGYVFLGMTVQSPYLFVIGLTSPTFTSGDYFPILPHLGWFMLGIALGRTAYRKKCSLLPNFPKDTAIVRFFRFCGRQSLWIYLLHQPILYGILMVFV